ncbi:MAG: efflux RND transporter periplasmic adaptor subunit, partial [Chitinophagales bacterium]
ISPCAQGFQNQTSHRSQSRKLKKLDMKKRWYIILGIVIVGIIAWIMFSKKSETKEEDKSAFIQPQIRDIENKQLLSGRLQSSKEVNIKSELAGIIDQLYVKVGDEVRAGQAIGKIRTLPDPRASQDANRQIETSQINLERIKANYLRNKMLFEKEVISKMEYESSLQEYKIAQNDLSNARANQKITRQGFSNKSDFVSNIIYSTIDGVVLDLPAKVGSTIQNRNNFSEGTTIATVADVNEFVFRGQVSEKDLKHIEINKELDIKISALKGEKFKARISKISPKGVDVSGITRFDFEAILIVKDTELYKIRSGYTAIGELVIQNVKQAMTLEEKYIQYSGDTTFVYVKKDKASKEKKIVTVGISDGQYIEIKSGLKKEDKIFKELSKEDGEVQVSF